VIKNYQEGSGESKEVYRGTVIVVLQEGEAGKLIMNLPKLWEKADMEERRKLLLTMLDAVYVDAMKTKSIVAIKPKPPFKPVFQAAASCQGSDILILNEPIKGSSLSLVKSGSTSVPYPAFYSSVLT
jgi:site-specific DNA recombinase